MKKDALIPLENASELKYPCIASAFLDYYATGEGRTIGALVIRVYSADQLREFVIRTWGEYFAQGVVVREWQGIPDAFDPLSGATVDKFLAGQSRSSFALEFVSTLHFNYV